MFKVTGVEYIYANSADELTIRVNAAIVKGGHLLGAPIDFNGQLLQAVVSIEE